MFLYICNAILNLPEVESLSSRCRRRLRRTMNAAAKRRVSSSDEEDEDELDEESSEELLDETWTCLRFSKRSLVEEATDPGGEVGSSCASKSTAISATIV